MDLDACFLCGLIEDFIVIQRRGLAKVKKLTKIATACGMILLLLAISACSMIRETEDEKAVRETFRDFCISIYEDNSEKCPMEFYSQNDKKVAAKLFAEAATEIATEHGERVTSKEKKMLRQQFIKSWDRDVSDPNSSMNQNNKRKEKMNLDKILKENGRDFNYIKKKFNRTPAKILGIVVEPSGEKAHMDGIDFIKEDGVWKISMLETAEKQAKFKQTIKTELYKALKF